MDLENLEVYQLALKYGDDVWNIVNNWNYFQKDTIGKQFVKAADSIASNISEGYGRYHFRDRLNFYFYSRGSLSECKTWHYKANSRELMKEEIAVRLKDDLQKLSIKLNNLIKITRDQLRK